MKKLSPLFRLLFIRPVSVSSIYVILAIFIITFSLPQKANACEEHEAKKNKQTEQEIIINQSEFASWLKNFKKLALAEGISEEVFTKALGNVKPKASVIKLDRKQPESKLSFARYQKLVVSMPRIAKGKQMMFKHKDILAEISAKYNVPAEVIVALWGVETSFGKNTGGFYVPEALATLAYEGRREKLFTKELLNALKILQQKHIEVKDMNGSWAGAMGQTQFMPSSFLNFAVDYNGDGNKDIWHTHEDIFASIANYISISGWDIAYKWGRPVKLPSDFIIEENHSKKAKFLKEWQDLGLKTSYGKNLPIADIKARLITLDKGKNEEKHYLVYNNFDVLLKWNRSNYFATAVNLLAEKIR